MTRLIGLAPLSDRERDARRREGPSREQYLAHMKRRYDEHRLIVDMAKSVPCMDCGGSFPVECMDLDHVRGTKHRHVAALITAALPKLMAEIAKCDAVCSNCHRVRTRKRRELEPWPMPGPNKRVRQPATVQQLETERIKHREYGQRRTARRRAHQPI